MVSHTTQLAALGEQLVEVAAPPSGIFGSPPPDRLSPIENPLDPTAHARRGFRCLTPDGFKDCEYVACVDDRHVERADLRIRVSFKRAAPLGAMLRILPCIGVCRDVPLARFSERE